MGERVDLRLEIEQRGAVTVLRPAGPLCAQEATTFCEAVVDAFERSLGRCVLEASRIAYVDSQGLEALLDTSEKIASMGHSLRICAANATLREVLVLTELAPHFEFFADVGAAARSLL
jgi:anti-anti-sigma factor